MTFAYRVFATAITAAALCWLTAGSTCAQEKNSIADTQPENNDIQLPVNVTAFHAETWQQGATKITALRGGTASDGRAAVRQGELELRGENIVLVESITDGVNNIRVYAEGRVIYQSHGFRKSMGTHLMLIQALQPVEISAASNGTVHRATALMRKAFDRIAPSTAPITTAGFQSGLDPFRAPELEPIPPANAPTSRRIQIRPRSSQPLQFDSEIVPGTEPKEQLYILTGGVNVLVDGLQVPIGGRKMPAGVLDISADRVVIWTQADDEDGDLGPGGTGTFLQSLRSMMQIYMEGNILIRQGENTITASHAFYDANNDRALMLNAELRAMLPLNDGTFRVRAERLRQISVDKFHAQNGWSTTSAYGKPGYRLQASDIFVEPGPISPFTKLDPRTRLPVNGPPMWVTAVNSQLLIGDVPVLSFPRLTAPAEDPNIPIRRAVVKQDRIFGVQVKTVWNLTKILGQKKQEGMQWDLLADYLSRRGPALGVQGEYNVQTLFGQAIGSSSIIWQLDQSTDNLGLDRKSLVPKQENRGQIIWKHKQKMPGQVTLFGEIGYVTDRNYRESFHEQAFDSEKDVETILGIRKDAGLYSGSLWARTELNEFETSTDWLPRADAYAFSQPLFGGAAYWTAHSSVGYADLENGRPPTDPNDPFVAGAMSGVADSSGIVAMTRHQLDAPFQLGALTVNPFVMGEAAFWDDGLLENDVDRYIGSAGVRASLSAMKVMPFVRSSLWNLNGLAHRSENTVEYRFTDVSRNLDEIAQYNEIDDNANERGRIRYTIQDFGGIVPDEFDPRSYAVRHGAGLWVTAPYHELADDQQVVRLVSRNRLQTKVGPPGAERIRDWMIWESGATFFPNAADDNFGEDFGLIFSNYRWNINDRTSFLASGILDLFENSQDVWSVGFLNQRSTRGSLYVGYRQVQAHNYLDSQTLVASYSYRMSPKWISTGSIAYDIAAGESRGSSLTFSRIGLDWVLHMGFGIDTSKDNVGLAFALEPRFGPPTPTNMSYLLGLDR